MSEKSSLSKEGKERIATYLAISGIINSHLNCINFESDDYVEFLQGLKDIATKADDRIAELERAKSKAINKLKQEKKK